MTIRTFVFCQVGQVNNCMKTIFEEDVEMVIARNNV